MDSRTLVKKGQQLSSMFFYLRTPCFVKNLFLVVVLLCAAFVGRCSVNELPNELDFEACGFYKGNYETTPKDLLDGRFSSKLASSLENVCPRSNLVCFPSTLKGFLVNDIDTELEALDTNGVKLLGGRIVSCSLHIGEINGQENDVSASKRPIFDPEKLSSKSGENVEEFKTGFLNSFSTPPVEIKPSLLDWGRKNMYEATLAFLTVENRHSEYSLKVFHPYSSNSQFYPCNFSEISLPPGELASICFVFAPTKLGLTSAQIVLQTNFGGFLIQAKGFTLDSPFLIKPLGGPDFSSNGRWRKDLSLYNPFDDSLFAEEVIAWFTVSSGNSSSSSKAICTVQSTKDSVENGEVGVLKISMTPLTNFEIRPRETRTLLELDLSHRSFQGKIVGAFLMLLRSSKNKIETVMVPLEAELSQNYETSPVSISTEPLVQCKVFALSLRNDGPDLLSVVKVSEVGGSRETFRIKFIEGLVLFPDSITQVAILDYTGAGAPEVEENCKVIVLLNDTMNSRLEVSCADVVGVCSGYRLDSSVGYPPGIEETRPTEPDELILRNWKSQSTPTFAPVLDATEIQFPTVQIGKHSSQYISVKNPSQKPIITQLILNSMEVIDRCNTPDTLYQPSSSTIILGKKSIAPTKYGFSIPNDALTEAYIHPFGEALLGPILFQPSNRCEWRSSAIIRNNLSGVEWVSLRGFGGSISLTILEESKMVRSLDFKLNSLILTNFSYFSCSLPLTKEIIAKNTGDLPLEVVRLGVSGSDCNLDGFRVLDCKGFSLEPGESKKLQISYEITGFSSVTIKRDLEVALKSGIVMVPMKASLPIYMLNFCKRSLLWMRVKKASIMIIFAAFLIFLMVFLLSPSVTASKSQDTKNPFSNGSGLVGSVEKQEEKVVLESPCDDGHTPGKGQPEKTKLPSKHSPPVVKSDAQDSSDSRNLSVKVGNEKGRKRKKKRNSTNGLFEISSSQSSNSTPSSPLSPVTSVITTPRKARPISPDIQKKPVENKNPFSAPPQIEKQKRYKTKLSEPSYPEVKKVEENCDSSKPAIISLPKAANRAVLFPSATFPSAATKAGPSWTCKSPHFVRAPGPPPKVVVEENKVIVEEKFKVYDLWADRLLLSPRGYSSDFDSFFVRGPQTLLANYRLKSHVGSNE